MAGWTWTAPVSYTHLDVYKRQSQRFPRAKKSSGLFLFGALFIFRLFAEAAARELAGGAGKFFADQAPFPGGNQRVHARAEDVYKRQGIGSAAYPAL